VASVQENSRDLYGWAAGGKFKEYVEGTGKCYGLETSKQARAKHQSKPEQTHWPDRTPANAS